MAECTVRFRSKADMMFCGTSRSAALFCQTRRAILSMRSLRHNRAPPRLETWPRG
jgi:hypothetical protein